MTALLENTLALYFDAAPWLLLGLAAAGLIKAWVPEATLVRWLGGRGLGPVVRAAAIGAPLPLCSCGVLPAAVALRRGGASRGATVSFLVSTPETGVDSIAVTYALLGPFMAVVRPVAALASAVVSGLLAEAVPAPAPARKPLFKVVTAPAAGCGCDDGSCSPAPPPTVAGRALAGLRYAFTDILDDLALWLAGGLLAAGLLVTLVPPMTLAAWGQGPLAMLVMLLIGVPMYICATASTPLGAALLLAGVSPGAVLVFLLAGPATNAAAVAVLRKELGGKVVAAYLTGLAVTAVAAGLATDALVAAWDIDMATQLGAGDDLVPAPLAWASAVLLALFAIRPIRRLWLKPR